MVKGFERLGGMYRELKPAAVPLGDRDENVVRPSVPEQRDFDPVAPSMSQLPDRKLGSSSSTGPELIIAGSLDGRFRTGSTLEEHDRSRRVACEAGRRYSCGRDSWKSGRG